MCGSLYDVELDQARAAVGYWLTPGARGRGVASHAGKEDLRRDVCRPSAREEAHARGDLSRARRASGRDPAVHGDDVHGDAMGEGGGA